MYSPRIHNPPHHRQKHRSPPNHNRPIHRLRIQITPPHRRKTKHRHHQQRKRRRDRPTQPTPPPQIPRTRAESVPHDERPQCDGQSERDVGADSADGEDGGDGEGAAVDEKEEEDPDGGVHPDGVDGRLGVLVDGAGDPGEGEDAVAAVGVGYAGWDRRLGRGWLDRE